MFVVQVSPQVGGLGEDSAKPLKSDGARPPESEFSFHQFEPHHSTSAGPDTPCQIGSQLFSHPARLGIVRYCADERFTRRD